MCAMVILCNYCKTSVTKLVTLLIFKFVIITAIDVKPQKEVYIPDYSTYHNLTFVQKEIQRFADTFPDFVRLNMNFRSRLGRSQMVLHISNFTQDFHKPAPKTRILLSYGEHAREFVPVESLLFLLRNLTSGLQSPSGSPAELYTRHILTKMDVHIIGMANPDGRDYVETSHNYCWRGTSTGVDLNRNFDWEYGRRGSSADPTDEEYRGTYPFSEPECAVFKVLTQKLRFDLFVSFHSGIRQIYLPYADTHSRATRRQPANIGRMRELAAQLSSSTRHRYEYGKAYDLTQYTADGTSFDFMAGVRKIPFSLAVELWGSSHHVGTSCFDEFNPRNELLQRELQAIHPLYVSLFDYMIRWKFPRQPINPFHPGRTQNMPHPQNKQVNKNTSTSTVVMMAPAVVLVLLLCGYYGYWLPWCRHRQRVIRLKTLSSTLSLWGFVKSM